MRRAAHAFRTTRNGNVPFAQCDHLRRRYDGLHARSAQAIERQSRRFNRKAGIYGSDSSEVGRSEEHTSELQSLLCTSYAVFRLHKNNCSTTISISKTRLVNS